MYWLNISYKQFDITLNEIWLYESDPNAQGTYNEPDGKQWQHSIQGWRNWLYLSIGLDNGLPLKRWQAIIWTNTDLIHWHIYAASGEMS